MPTTYLRAAPIVRGSREGSGSAERQSRRAARGHDPQSIWGHARSRSQIRATPGAGQRPDQGCPIGGSP